MPELNQETLLDIQDKYEKAQSLIKYERDPQNEPYRSKYAAQEILVTLKSTISEIRDKLIEENNDSNQIERFTALLAAVWLAIGSISTDTEETGRAKVELENADELLHANPLRPRNIIVYLSTLNQMGVLYSILGQPEKAKEILENAEKCYHDFVNQDPIETPISIEDLFKANEKDISFPRCKAESKLEKCYTHIMYFLAQVHGALGDNYKSAVYCHNTLKRQLECNDYEPIDWALNSASLSQFFILRNRFKHARHHLAAALYILEKYSQEELKNTEGTEEEIEAKKERFKYRSADVARCWAKYGLQLLEASRDRLMELADCDDDSSPTEPPKSSLGDGKDDIEGLMFSTLELNTYESQMSDKFVLDYEDALPIFHATKGWLEEAKEYYTLEEQASGYASIIQDTSTLFRLLAFFESSDQRRCCMHKRRVDQLESVLASLNHQCYLTVCREIWFELGEIYLEMVRLKQDIWQASDKSTPDPHMLNKINTLSQKSIANFQSFLNSISGSQGSGKNKMIDAQIVRPALLAHFYLSRLYSRLITPNRELQIENNKKVMESIQFIIDYCDEHEDAAVLMTAELPVCKEMLELMPHKINRLSVQLSETSISQN